MSSKFVLNAKKKATSCRSWAWHVIIMTWLPLALFVGSVEILGDEQLVGEVVPPFAVETAQTK
jgi:hypothetical protein